MDKFSFANCRQQVARAFIALVCFVPRAVAASLLLLFVAAFVWCAQDTYDATHDYRRVFYYAVVIAGAGAAYDMAKAILFLPDTAFRAFAWDAIWGVVLLALAMSMSLLGHHQNTSGAFLSAWLLEGLAFLPLLYGIMKISAAATATVKQQ